MALTDGLRLAFGTLTVVPVPPPRTLDAPTARLAMLAGPIVVLPLSLAAASLAWGLVALGLPGVGGGLLLVGLLALATRGIHLDGLADTADGLAASFDRARALEVMRRGDVGPMGAATLVVALGLQGVCLGELLTRPWGWLAAGVVLASGRWALALGTAVGVPAARPEGLGQTVAGVVPVWAAAASWAAAAAASALVSVALGGPWWQGALSALAAALGGGMLLIRCVRRLGGITGDVLGALIEIWVTIQALVLAL